MAIILSFTLLFCLNTFAYAWHENLGIGVHKAAELYQTNPNDPAIIQWKYSLQSAINAMDNKCFEINTAMSCEPLFLSIISNCELHPNELLSCNDARFAQYPLILNKSKEAYLTRIPAYAVNVIALCFSSPESNTTFEVAFPSCDSELLSLQNDCQLVSSSYNYCKDERFVGYLKKYGILNSTVSP
jgi:hypothetical protein